MTTRTATARKANAYKKPTGYVVYKGKSLIDGKPIVVVAIVSESKNSKTGNMVQTYILRDGEKSPLDVVRDLDDVSICGDCKHRRGTGGSCYVNIGQGVMQVWKAYKNGNYPYMQPHKLAPHLKGRKVRLGTYGDPMAVPSWVWMDLVSCADGHTGYTHQWNPESEIVQRVMRRDPDQYEDIRALCMASVDNEDEWWFATYNNWRTFRVRGADDGLNAGEFICPASEEAGKKKICATCMACNGAGEKGSKLAKATPVIIVHGSLKKRFGQTKELRG